MPLEAPVMRAVRMDRRAGSSTIACRSRQRPKRGGARSSMEDCTRNHIGRSSPGVAMYTTAPRNAYTFSGSPARNLAITAPSKTSHGPKCGHAESIARFTYVSKAKKLLNPDSAYTCLRSEPSGLYSTHPGKYNHCLLYTSPSPRDRQK